MGGREKERKEEARRGPGRGGRWGVLVASEDNSLDLPSLKYKASGATLGEQNDD